MEIITAFNGQFAFLSNTYPCYVKAADLEPFASVEHAYQYEKFLGGWKTQEPIRKQIKEARTLAQAIRIAMRNYDLVPAEFQDKRIEVMRRLLAQKFRAGSLLAEMLRDTGNMKLINTGTDPFWGVVDVKSENWLGVLLMEIRRENVS